MTKVHQEIVDFLKEEKIPHKSDCIKKFVIFFQLESFFAPFNSSSVHNFEKQRKRDSLFRSVSASYVCQSEKRHTTLHLARLYLCVICVPRRLLPCQARLKWWLKCVVYLYVCERVLCQIARHDCDCVCVRTCLCVMADVAIQKQRRKEQAKVVVAATTTITTRVAAATNGKNNNPRFTSS